MIGIEKVPAKDAHQFELLEPGSQNALQDTSCAVRR